MLEVFHTNPSNDDPYPCHDGAQDDEGGIVADNGKSGVVLEFRRCIRGLANIPSPAPHVKAASHTNDKDDPSDDKDDPAPPLGFAVVVVFVRAIGVDWNGRERGARLLVARAATFDGEVRGEIRAGTGHRGTFQSRGGQSEAFVVVSGRCVTLAGGTDDGRRQGRGDSIGWGGQGCNTPDGVEG